MKFKQILSAPRPAAFCNFWPFGPSFPFILAFWSFIFFHSSLFGFYFVSFWPFGPLFPFILAFWAFISFHFGLLGFISFHFGFLGLDFLSFWRFGHLFPFILAFWAFISFHFLLAGAATWGPPHNLPKTVRFLIKFKQILSAAKPAAFCNFWHFLSFWRFGPSFPFILAFWAFISFHFGFLGLHFLSFWSLGFHFFGFWPFVLSFPFILAF